jgi:hypothetical protein
MRLRNSAAKQSGVVGMHRSNSIRHGGSLRLRRAFSAYWTCGGVKRFPDFFQREPRATPRTRRLTIPDMGSQPTAL